MDTFAPDLARYWHPEPVEDETVLSERDAEGSSEAAALEALADRINAARLVL